MSGMSKKVTAKDGPTHPKYSVMITEAMKALKSRTGSSRTALLKQIKGVHDVGDEKKATMYLSLALKKGVEKGIFKKARDEGKNSNKFKLGENAEVKKPTKKAKTSTEAKKPKAKKSTKKAKTSTVAKKPKVKKSIKQAKTSTKAKKPKAKKSIKKAQTSTKVKKPKAKTAVLPK